MKEQLCSHKCVFVQPFLYFVYSVSVAHLHSRASDCTGPCPDPMSPSFQNSQFSLRLLTYLYPFFFSPLTPSLFLSANQANIDGNTFFLLVEAPKHSDSHSKTHALPSFKIIAYLIHPPTPPFIPHHSPPSHPFPKRPHASNLNSKALLDISLTSRHTNFPRSRSSSQVHRQSLLRSRACHCLQ